MSETNAYNSAMDAQLYASNAEGAATVTLNPYQVLCFLKNALSIPSNYASTAALSTTIINAIGAQYSNYQMSEVAFETVLNNSYGNNGYPSSLSVIAAKILDNLNLLGTDVTANNLVSAIVTVGTTTYTDAPGQGPIETSTGNINALINDVGIARATIINSMGPLSNLLTENRSDLVSSINEVYNMLSKPVFASNLPDDYSEGDGCTVTLASVGYNSDAIAAPQQQFYISMLCGKCYDPLACADYFLSWS